MDAESEIEILKRIERAVEQLSAALPDNWETADQIDRIEALLTKIADQAEKQTAALEKMLEYERGR